MSETAILIDAKGERLGTALVVGRPEVVEAPPRRVFRRRATPDQVTGHPVYEQLEIPKVQIVFDARAR